MSTAYTGRLLQVMASTISLAIILWSLGLPSWLPFAEAANLTDVSNTLSDSDPSALSNHGIEFTIPTGSNGIDASGEQIIVTFPTGFTGTSSIVVGDVDLEINTVDETLVTGLTPAANQWGFAWSGNNLILQSGGGTAVITATDDAFIKVGTNANGGTNRITNPAATGTYEFIINVAASQDTGATSVAIIENIDVSASVNTLFTFEIAGVAGGSAVNGTTTTGLSTATSIPFGTLSPGGVTTTAQDLTVTTNATQGYVVTVVADQNLMSSTGAVIDGFANGSYTEVPTSWIDPTGTAGQANTYGHWGLTSDDATTTRTAEFDSGEWASPSTTPVVIMSHNGPADGITQGIGTARVGYQVEITSLQEAGDDYSTTLTYVATPTF